MQTISYVVAGALLLAFVAIIATLNVLAYRARKYRKSLPLEEQERLDKEDALWLQGFGL